MQEAYAISDDKEQGPYPSFSSSCLKGTPPAELFFGELFIINKTENYKNIIRTENREKASLLVKCQ